MGKVSPHLTVFLSIFLFIASVFFFVYVILQQTSSLYAPLNPGEDTPSDPNMTPSFEVQDVLVNLNLPWDIGFLPNGRMIYTEKSGRVSIIENGNSKLITEISDVYNRGEGGLLGLAIDPNFQENRYFYTCFNSTANGLDVRVVRWEISEDYSSLENRKDIITGMPSSTSGRHSGCQLEFGPDDNLWVGTGDIAVGTNPQDPQNLGGKILRVNREGQGVEGNLGGNFDSRIFSYGHRNIQGIAFLRTTSSSEPVGVTAEHGPRIDDEINMLVKGNFGWDPIPGYNEGVPMTDKNKFPDSIESVWNSGNPTIAISGMTQITGDQWKLWDGAIAVAALAGNQVKVLKFSDSGSLEEVATILTNIGRVRTIQQGPGGYLYVLTSNGSNLDRILRLIPR